MLALSIRQPYAELILRGEKVVEYRSRPTRLIGVRFAIYAARKWAGVVAHPIPPIHEEDGPISEETAERGPHGGPYPSRPLPSAAPQAREGDECGPHGGPYANQATAPELPHGPYQADA